MEWKIQGKVPTRGEWAPFAPSQRNKDDEVYCLQKPLALHGTPHAIYIFFQVCDRVVTYGVTALQGVERAPFEWHRPQDLI